jgi:hypothetical protein
MQTFTSHPVRSHVGAQALAVARAEQRALRASRHHIHRHLLCVGLPACSTGLMTPSAGTFGAAGEQYAGQLPLLWSLLCTFVQEGSTSLYACSRILLLVAVPRVQLQMVP